MTVGTIEGQIARYRASGLLIDTNILLLLFVGTVDRSLISRFKRTAQFTAKDYDLLVRLAGTFPRVVTLPNILTEVSNLAGQLTGTARATCFAALGRAVEVIDEHYLPSRGPAASPRLAQLGLTDVALLELARGRFLVLTDDFRLAQVAAHEGVDAINFNHLRSFAD